MKRFKIFLTVLAVVLGMAGAFATRSKVVKLEDGTKWYQFTGSATDDPNVASNYTLTGNGGEDVPSCPADNEIRCAVRALPASSSQPDMSEVRETKDTYIP